MPAPAPQTLPSLRTMLPWLGVVAVFVGLLYVLAPTLTPFLVGIIIAYAGNPLVDRLVRWRIPRAIAAVLVLAAFWLLIATLVLMLVPLIREEATRIADRLPQAITQLNTHIAPWAERVIGMPLTVDADFLQSLIRDHRDIVQSVVQQVFNSLRIGGLALAGVVVNAMLAPVVSFYLMVDWHRLVRRIDTLIPRQHHERASAIAGDVDAVMSAYLRGQLLVMAILAAYYSIGLAIAGIPSALALGVLTGTLIFIPYIGFATSFVLALTIALLQFAGWPPIFWVLGVYAIGQVLESFVLTPYLVGEKVGLPPLAVIFALMAFGQVFGFFGVLLALPASAAILIGLRELHRGYLDSRFYRGT